MIIIIIGVSGSGKTTVGQLLSEKAGLSFYDADDYHPQNNIKKMIYLHSKEEIIDLLLFSICTIQSLNKSKIEDLINYIKKVETPKFPISGNYLKKYGYTN